MTYSSAHAIPESSEARFDVVVIASHGESLVTFRGELLEQMRARGHRVLALAPGLTAKTRAWLEQTQVAYAEAPLARTGTNPLADIKLFLWLRRQIRSADPSVVLAYTVKPVVYGMLASTMTGARRYALITGLGYAFTDGAGDRKLLRFVLEQMYRLALFGANAVFFQNCDDEAFFRTRRMLRPAVPSFVLAGSGICLDRFARAPLPEGSTSFLMIARLLGDKGVREYIAAARMLKRRHPEVAVRLVGWIDDNPDAIQPEELHEWVAEGVVEYLGRLADVRPAIRAATVFVLPSYREGTPRTVLEAMAIGRPIITTDAPGCRETVMNGENGFLVPTKSPEALFDAMRRFASEPSLAQGMAARSREIAEAKYDVRRVSTTMLQHMKLEGSA